MEKIIIEIVESLYGLKKKNILSCWEKLNSILLKEEIDKKTFRPMFQFFVLAQTLGACLGEDTVKLK